MLHHGKLYRSLTSDTNMADHRANLARVCRVCGVRFAIKGRKPKSVKTFRDTIAHLYGDYNVDQDMEDVHPPFVCEKCRKTLMCVQQKLTSGKQVTTTLKDKLPNFNPHVDGSCGVCVYKQGGRPARKPRFPPPRAPPADVNTQPASPASTADVNAQPTSARDVYWENHLGEQQHRNQEQCAGLTQPPSLQRKRRKSGSQGNDLILDLTTGTKKNVQIVQTMTKLATGTALVAEKTDGKIDEEQSDCGVSKRRKVVEVSLSETHEDNTGHQPTAGGTFYTRETQDDSYFSAYADIDIHEDMLADTVRTNAYRLAILRCWEQIRGKVVVDVGAGTGILSLFCVQAGARKVYAIEASALAEETRKVVKANGMEGRIEVVHGRAEEVELPEKVDVIVSEWMGYSLLYESMLPSVIYVRDKWLKKGGLLLPSKATMYLAPITDAEVEDRLQFWEDIGTKYHVDMSALKPYAHRCITRKVQVKPVQMEDILATPAKVMTFDLTEVSAEDLSCVQGAFSFSCYGWSQMQGFATWFDVLFPSPKPVLLSTSPYSEDTHWMQSVMSLDESVQVTQDTRVNGVIKITPNSRNNRFLDMAVKYSIDGREEVERLYPMDDCR